MYDLTFFRTHLEEIAERLKTRGFELDLEAFRDLDARRRAAITEAEQLKAQRNAESNEIAKLRRQGADTTERQQNVRRIGERIAALDEQVRQLEEEFRQAQVAAARRRHYGAPAERPADR